MSTGIWIALGVVVCAAAAWLFWGPRITIIERISMGSVAQEGDATTLRELEKAGSDLAKPHEIDFFLYFPSKDRAEGAASDMRELGYKATVGTRAFEGQWSCEGAKILVPSEGSLSKCRAELDAIATKFGGEYDGWGSGVVD
ncbi:MAG: ribonuclease E inhibitor RraB [Fimbriimonadaceae bacterium]